MGRTSRRREQLRRVQENLTSEQTRILVGLGILNALVVVGLDTALAVMLARSIRRGRRERQRGLAGAVQAGATPGLIGLAGAMSVNELIRAMMIRALVRPALNRTESSPSPSS